MKKKWKKKPLCSLARLRLLVPVLVPAREHAEQHDVRARRLLQQRVDDGGGRRGQLFPGSGAAREVLGVALDGHALDVVGPDVDDEHLRVERRGRLAVAHAPEQVARGVARHGEVERAAAQGLEVRGPDGGNALKLLVRDSHFRAAEGLEDGVAVEDDVGAAAGEGLDLVGVLVVDLF